MGNKVVHLEFMGADGEAQKEFYEGLFGWKSAAVPGFGHYYMVEADDAGVGAAVGQGSEEMPNYMIAYIEVESIDDHLAKINAAGGSTVVPRTVIPDTVTFAMFTDPAGNMVGLVEADA